MANVHVKVGVRAQIDKGLRWSKFFGLVLGGLVWISGCAGLVSSQSSRTSPAPSTPYSGHSATATWTASTSVVSGYNVYRATISGGPYAKLNSSPITLLTYNDTSVQSAQTYYYVATAVDTIGNESVFSNEVVAVIP